ncbi:thiamine pyrophosphate-binding protein [Pendulispora albinea]|uniref:Thiamine pyrophosphate-binding protein n=1 Tax=Pendulispora albinea TaxID=2741071 RepID=A0ABZ2LPH9_9BACT
MVDLLCGLGVDTFFGIPGGSIIAVFDAIVKNPKATLIEPRHETHAAFEAMGAFRASGRAAAVLVTSGPGATNVVTGVAAAHFERVPMLVMAGDTAWERTGRRLLQSLGPEGVDIEEMLRGLTRTTVRLGPTSALAQVRAAVRAARNPRNPGPVLIVAPIDCLDGAARAERPRTLPLRVAEGAIDPARLAHAAQMLARAERPLVVVGAACRPAADPVRRLVDAIGAPFMTTPQAKGIVPEDHPLSLRNGGMSSSLWARRYSDTKPDVALVLGTDLDDVSTAGTPPVGPGGRVIHVDTDPRAIGRNFPTALALVHDVGAVAEELARIPAFEATAQRGAELAARARLRSPFDVPDFDADDSLPIAPHRVIADLERALPPQATIVTDIGEHMLFALHYLTARSPERFVIHLGLGSMASGIASAVGLALADRSRPVACICGDGGMHMAGMEILLAIKHRLPIVYAVFNDARYNMVHHGHRMTYTRTDIAACASRPWETPPIDFVKWAEATGARGVRIERPGEITRGLLEGAMADRVPLVLDIRQARDTRISGDGRIQTLIAMAGARP